MWNPTSDHSRVVYLFFFCFGYFDIFILLFTHHYSAMCFGINVAKFRDAQAKIHSITAGNLEWILATILRTEWTVTFLFCFYDWHFIFLLPYLSHKAFLTRLFFIQKGKLICISPIFTRIPLPVGTAPPVPFQIWQRKPVIRVWSFLEFQIMVPGLSLPGLPHISEVFHSVPKNALGNSWLWSLYRIPAMRK